jgi:hypothetical protein
MKLLSVIRDSFKVKKKFNWKRIIWKVMKK